jgi:hypothetical protein
MRWLDEHIRRQPPGEIQQGIQAARAYRHQLWQSAFRVGAVASFTELGDPDPRVLAERTLRTLLTDVWAAGGFDQVHALEHADTKTGWHLAYFAGWNAALDLLEEQAAANGERPQLIQDTGRAEMLASQLLQAAASAGWIAQLEQRLGRSRLPDAARSVTRFARQATRAVQRAFRRESPRPQTASPESPVYESAYWPGAPPVELDPIDDEDLAAEARAMTPMSPRSADVIDISRRSTRSASMHPPPAAYPSKNSSKPARKPAKPRKKPAKPRKRQAQAQGGGSSEGPASA